MFSFKQYLLESNDIDRLRQALDELGVDHSVHHSRPGYLHVGKIIVPKDRRNEGVGTEAMKRITAYADGKQKRVTLTPSSDFGGSKSRLIKFYKRHGFVENKGRNKDYSTREAMYRDPKQ